jgi:L-asparaginase
MADQSSATGARRIVVLGTGGTIAGRAAQGADNVGYVAGQVGVSALLEGISAPEGFSLEVEQVAQLDSKDMDFATWRRLALRCAHWLADPGVCGVVITHGTDTLEETAYFLQRVLPAHDKPVVLTCAMRPATSLSPDGPQNVRDALAVAATKGAQGVCVVCAGTVHDAADVQKVHTYQLDAFSSGDAGPLGHVEEGELRRLRAWPASTGGQSLAVVEAASVAPRVEILLSHAGASAALIDLLLRERASTGAAEPLMGLVLAATGNGTLHHEIEAAALRAQADGVAVLRATRCVQGRILPKATDPLRAAGSLSPVKARVALLLELMSGGA